MGTELDAVEVLHELERLGIKWETVNETEVRVKCPSHSDDHASCSISTEKKLFRCHTAGCGAKGDFLTFISLVEKIKRQQVVDYVRKEYRVSPTKTISRESVERFHKGIWSAEACLHQLRIRAISDETIRAYRLGVDNKERITIPIFNEDGKCVNIRRYRPGAPDNVKMTNTKGHGKSTHLYPVDQLSYDKIVVAGGECKALAVLERLNQHGIGSVSVTAGEGHWIPQFNSLLEGKAVYICYDIDAAGVKGARKVATRLHNSAAEVRIIRLPLDIDEYPKGDVNDYLYAGGDLLSLIEDAEVFSPSEDEAEVAEYKSVSLAHVTSVKNARSPVETIGVITAYDTTPYIVPKTVSVDCTRDQPFCSECPVFAKPNPPDGFVTLTIRKDNPSIPEYVNAGNRQKNTVTKQALGIPSPCKVCTFHEQGVYNVDDVRVAPALDVQMFASENVMLPTLCVREADSLPESNITYRFRGRVHPHPKTQQAVFLVNSMEPADDALSSFEPGDFTLESLKACNPDSWTVEGVNAKLEKIYDDLSANVTRIYDRQSLHLFADLVWHSALMMTFDGRVEKAWTEILVIGDSSQGKTEVSSRLREHYGLGSRVDAKGASVAGLIGGVIQTGNRWMIEWGMFPRCDRTMLILEELKGASEVVIGKLTDMRSSGIATIEKVKKGATMARVRLLAVSNPRGNVELASYSHGVRSAVDLTGSLEDLRRFDAVYFVSAGDIDATRLTQLTSHRPDVEHNYTSDLCRQVILWAWSRTADQVIVDEESKATILEETKRLCDEFVDAIPIVDKGSQRLKLARLSIALAARLGSFDPDDPSKLKLRPCIVKAMSQLLIDHYNSSSAGYGSFSRSYKETYRLRGEKEIVSAILTSPFPDDFIDSALHCDTIDIQAVQDWTGYDKSEAQRLVSLLVRKRALFREERYYRKNPAFNDLLFRLKDSAELERTRKPGHVGGYNDDQF